MNQTSNVWNDARALQLVEALCLIEDTALMMNFLRDILTEKEIIEIASRLKAAQMLFQGSTYIKIANATGLSSRTIARISEWTQKDTKGYSSVIALLEDHHKHMSPAPAAS